MKRNIAILVTTLLYISWTSERIVPCSSLAARRFKTRGPPKKGVGKNTDDAWEKKLLELAYTAESGNKYVELIVKGITPPQPLRYQFLYAGQHCCIIGHQIPSSGGKTTCMVWSLEKEFGTLSSECKPTLDKYCEGPYNIPSRSVYTCPETQ
nr:uncharacterized protein LOC129383447 isoform X4 [Dermacentor andersoni]